MKLRIEYDDDALTIIEKVNDCLESRGIAFECDNQEHDGFEIYELVEVSDEEDDEDEE